jgi:hypothetical protein
MSRGLTIWCRKEWCAIRNTPPTAFRGGFTDLCTFSRGQVGDRRSRRYVRGPRVLKLGPCESPTFPSRCLWPRTRTRCGTSDGLCNQTHRDAARRSLFGSCGLLDLDSARRHERRAVGFAEIADIGSLCATAISRAARRVRSSAGSRRQLFFRGVPIPSGSLDMRVLGRSRVRSRGGTMSASDPAGVRAIGRYLIDAPSPTMTNGAQ